MGYPDNEPNKLVLIMQVTNNKSERPREYLEWKLIAAWERISVGEAQQKWSILEPITRARYSEMLTRLRAGYPLDYLLPVTQILDKQFQLRPGVLIPRPETEELITLIQAIPNKPPTLVDIGCGSGLIGICLSAEFEQVIMLDISLEALQIARQNIERNEVGNASVARSDLLADLPKIQEDWWLVANLPYVPAGDKEREAEYRTTHEPDLAIYSGADGLDLFRRLVTQLQEVAHPPRRIFFELDPRNIHTAQELLRESGDWSPKILQDLAGRDRFLIA